MIKPIYLESFSCIGDIINNFELKNNELDDCEILIAKYETPPYEGYAYVLYRKEGEYFEVNGSHCSCYGLEGQWQPDKITLDDLKAYESKKSDPYRAEIIRQIEIENAPEDMH